MEFVALRRRSWKNIRVTEKRIEMRLTLRCRTAGCGRGHQRWLRYRRQGKSISKAFTDCQSRIPAYRAKIFRGRSDCQRFSTPARHGWGVRTIALQHFDFNNVNIKSSTSFREELDELLCKCTFLCCQFLDFGIRSGYFYGYGCVHCRRGRRRGSCGG